MEANVRSILDTPLEPVIGLARGETRWAEYDGFILGCLKIESEAGWLPIVLWPDRGRWPIVQSMRLKSSIWVAAYLRRCQTEGIFGAVRRRGAEEAGAVFVKVALLDGNAMLYAPAPQTVYDDSRPIERIFAATSPRPVPEASVEERLAKEVRFDPDVWIVETEDRAGRHFLDLARA
jgi:hypothetical protein